MLHIPRSEVVSLIHDAYLKLVVLYFIVELGSQLSGDNSDLILESIEPFIFILEYLDFVDVIARKPFEDLIPPHVLQEFRTDNEQWPFLSICQSETQSL
jgi:hypothetical protein